MYVYVVCPKDFDIFFVQNSQYYHHHRFHMVMPHTVQALALFVFINSDKRIIRNMDQFLCQASGALFI